MDHIFDLTDRNGALNHLPKERRGALFVSIKNRQFNTALIDAFCHFVQDHCAEGYITIVDKPYLHNITRDTVAGAERDRQILNLKRLSEDRTRNATKRIRNAGCQVVRLINWSEMAAQTPSWIGTELNTALAENGPFAAAVTDHAAQVMSTQGNANIAPTFTDFLMEELPVLLHAFYHDATGIVDCYPAPQVPLFWRIDRGDFASELPKVAALVKAAPRLFSADIQPVEESA